MPTETAKQQALSAIQRLPENVELDEIVYRLHALDKVHQGLGDVDAGRTLSTDELDREIEQW